LVVDAARAAPVASIPTLRSAIASRLRIVISISRWLIAGFNLRAASPRALPFVNEDCDSLRARMHRLALEYAVRRNTATIGRGLSVRAGRRMRREGGARAPRARGAADEIKTGARPVGRQRFSR
jgi:hypothetical protein